MSLFNNTDLINKLLKYGEPPSNPNTLAPGARKVINDMNIERLKYAQQLVKNLQENKSSLFTSSSNASINIAELSSIQKFIDFLFTNHIQYNGQDIISDLDKTADKNYIPIPNAENPKFYIYKDGMVAFINDLKSKNKDNPLFNGLLNKNIMAPLQRLNLEWNKDQKKPSTDLSPDTFLTTFPKNLDLKQYQNDGDVKLFYKDILNKTALLYWINTNDISIPIINKPNEFLTIDSNLFDVCLVVKHLFNKANYLLQNKATTPQLNYNYTAFVNKLKEIAPQFMTLDGKQFSLGSVTSSSQTTSAESQEDLNKLYMDIDPPLNDNAIDFVKIKEFLEKFKSILNHPSTKSPIAPGMLSAIADVESFINKTSELMHGLSMIPLKNGIQGINGVIKNATNNRLFLLNLSDIINKTLGIILRFNSLFLSNKAIPEDTKTLFKSQQYIAQTNTTSINGLIANIPSSTTGLR